MKNLFSGAMPAEPGGPSYEYSRDAGPVQKMAHKHFMSLRDVTLDYYGADDGEHTFMVDGVVFKVLEDPADGYRSCLGVIDYTGEDHNSIFFSAPIAQVKIQTFDEHSKVGEPVFGTNNNGYRLIDVDDGHIWLEFGTENYDDYYPCFIFRHCPKEPK